MGRGKFCYESTYDTSYFHFHFVFFAYDSTIFVFSFEQMLSIRMEELLVQHEQQIVSMVTEESKQRQLLLEDEEEDFLDEGT